jgi:hypothetical protein
MKLALFFLTIWLGLFGAAPADANGLSDEQLTAIRDGFAARREQMLRQQLAKPYPAADGEDDHSRVWNRLDYALAALYLNVDLDQANQAVIEAAKRSTKGMSRPEGKKEYPFHWEAPLYCRIYEFFHPASRIFPGRLRPEAAEAIRSVLWQWAKSHAQFSGADTAKVWHYWGSENHSAMRDCSAWGIAQVLKGCPAYASRRYDDGSTAVQQYEAWTGFLKEYLRERVRKGLLVETASPTYSKYTLQCWYNYYDFADDPQLKRLADIALTVYWTDWAQEQFGGVRGGGKSRCYQGGSDQRGLDDGAAALAWYYLGIGRAASSHPGVMCMATSGHRLPLVVMDIALDVEGRGTYVYRSRRPGLLAAQPSASSPFADPESARNALDPAFGGIVRYTYCTPDFILGSNLVPKLPNDAWSGISSQNCWQGAIFPGDPDARIFPQCVGLRNGKTYNQHWSVQSKGTAIVQKLPDKTYSKQAGDMRVWFASSLKRSEAGGWVFAEAKGAFAAVRPAMGGYAWDDANWLRCRDAAAPVIIAVARKTEYRGMEAFQAAVLSNRLEIRDDALVYEGRAGAGLFRFPLKSDRLPEVDGKPIDLRPEMTFDSPFLKEEWSSGVVTIAKGPRRLTLDLRAGP